MAEKDGRSYYPRAITGNNIPLQSSQEVHQRLAGVKTAVHGENTTFVNPAASGFPGGMGAGGGDVLRSPSRKWYDPEWTALTLVLPKTRLFKNRWRRFFYLYDPIVGGVIDLHAELPHSGAQLFGTEDESVLNTYLDAVDAVDLFNRLPDITREYLKMGEAFPYFRWDDTKGYFNTMVLQNADFIEIEQSMLAEEPDAYYLVADPQLRAILENNDPMYRDVKRKLPMEFVRAIVYGEKLPLPFDEDDLFIGLRKLSSPSEVRGTGIIDRLFRHLIYEDKLLDAQIAIADNFIYPLRMIKLGNDDWIPNAEQLDAFQEILAQKQFDPNFYLITHNAVTYESNSLAADVMTLGGEWERIDKIKMLGLGISQTFMTGESTYASAHVGFQTALARYKSIRNLMETQIIRPFFRRIAVKNGFIKRSKRELNGQYRVSKKLEDLTDRDLIIPELDWDKKLTIREDESYLNFLAGLKGKFPISDSTFMSALGLSYKKELERGKRDEELKERLGLNIEYAVERPKDKGEESAEGEEGGGGLFGSWFKNRVKFSKKPKTEHEKDIEFIRGLAENAYELTKGEAREKTSVEKIYSELLAAHQMPISDRDANFFTGVKSEKPTDIAHEHFVKKAAEEGAKRMEEEDYLNLVNENYELNYRLGLSSGIVDNLKAVDKELSSVPIRKEVLKTALLTLLEESTKMVQPYIANRTLSIDNNFIFQVLKSDVTEELERFSSSFEAKKDKIRRLALAAVLLGKTMYYSIQKVPHIKMSSVFDDRKKIKLIDIHASGLNSVYGFVNHGIIPKIYPVMSGSEADLQKLNYITSSKTNGIQIVNCPNYIIQLYHYFSAILF